MEKPFEMIHRWFRLRDQIFNVFPWGVRLYQGPLEYNDAVMEELKSRPYFQRMYWV
jgi:hypothetical protein